MPTSQTFNPTLTIPMLLIAHLKLLSSEKYTLIAILALARDEDGFAPVTARELGAIIGVKHWTVRHHIRTFEARGLVYRGHQFEHREMIGGCPWDECYGIYIAFRSNGKLHPWASELQFDDSICQPEALERLSAI